MINLVIINVLTYNLSSFFVKYTHNNKDKKRRKKNILPTILFRLVKVSITCIRK